MRKSGRLDADVDIAELATLTKNFSGAEIEGLVRAAQSTSLNSYVTATSKVRALYIVHWGSVYSVQCTLTLLIALS